MIRTASLRVILAVERVCVAVDDLLAGKSFRVGFEVGFSGWF
jgi:hypothetical protein